MSFDLRTKVPLYAQAGVPEYWVADVNARTIHRFRDSDGSVYRSVQQFGIGDTITIEALPNGSLNVSDILD